MNCRNVSAVIQHKLSRKYLCWNSFKSKWYWGNRDHSEKFYEYGEREKIAKLLEQNPNSILTYVNDSDGTMTICTG